jgi:(p)ppGpp synthase/HD superfamily hydrolase
VVKSLTHDMSASAFPRMPLSADALSFAREHHDGREVWHPFEVAVLLRDAGYPDAVVATGMLHEVLEDTDVERDELEDRFGQEVAGLVESLSDDPSIEDVQERRAALRLQVATAGPTAAAVFAADKVSKARELRLKASRGALGDEERLKLEHYEESLDMLVNAMPRHELVEQLRLELESLRAL